MLDSLDTQTKDVVILNQNVAHYDSHLGDPGGETAVSGGSQTGKSGMNESLQERTNESRQAQVFQVLLLLFFIKRKEPDVTILVFKHDTS